MRVPDAGPTSADRLTVVLLVLMAGAGLGSAGLGAFVLVKIRNDTADLPQPYLYTEGDRDAEKLAQLRSIAARQAVEPALRSPTAVAVASQAVPPLPAAKDAEPKPPSSAPPAALPSNEERKPAEPPPNRRERSKSAAPSAAPAPRVAAPATRDALVGYVADEIANLRIDQRSITSRMAVTEAAIEQLQKNKTIYDWFALGASLVGSVQGLLGSIVLLLNMRRPKAVPSSG